MRLVERYSKIRNRNNFPKLNYIIDFIKDAAFLLIIIFIAELFHWLVYQISELFASGTANDISSYLPVKATRILATVLDSVAILNIIIIGFFTLFKLIRDYFK